MSADPPISGEQRDDDPPLSGHSGPEDRGEPRETLDESSVANLTQPGVDKHPVTGGPAVSPADPAAVGGNPDLRPAVDLDSDDIPH